VSERVDLAALPWQAWKNGAGRTREIAVEPPGAGFDHFDWRLSVAQVDRDAPFSPFPGVDRCIVLLQGAGLRLCSDDGRIDHRLDGPLQPLRFPGEIELQASLLDGATTDFNVMTRRGRWRSNVNAADKATHVAAADATLLLAVAGAWSAGDERIESGHGLLWCRPHGDLAVTPQRDADARLLVVRLLRETAR
jgi:environmental stress-induced protein Ves